MRSWAGHSRACSLRHFQPLAPVAHADQYWLERLAELGQLVLDLRRDLGEDGALDDAVRLELAQLQGDHARGGRGCDAAEGVEAQPAVQHVEDRDRLPHAALLRLVRDWPNRNGGFAPACGGRMPTLEATRAKVHDALRLVRWQDRG